MLKIAPIKNLLTLICLCPVIVSAIAATDSGYLNAADKDSTSNADDRFSDEITAVFSVTATEDPELMPVTFLQPSPGNYPELNQPAPANAAPVPLTNRYRGSSSGSYYDHAIQRGINFLRCEQPMAALDAMMCTGSATQDIKHYKMLTIGAALGELDMISEARCYYSSVARSSQNEEIRRLANQSISELDRYVYCREEERFWFKATTFYDSNPAILPIFNAVGIPDQNADSSFGNSYLFGFEKDIARADNSELTVGGVAYGSENYSGHQYDIGRYSGYLRYTHRNYINCTPTYSGIVFNYDYVTVGDNSFLNNPIVSPWVTIQHDDRYSTVLYGDYKYYDFLGQGALDGTALDTDSHYGRVGITERYRFLPCNNLLVALGYQYAMNDSQGSDYDYGSHNIVSYLIWEIPETETLVTLAAEYHIRDYDNANSIITTTTREDREFILGAELLHPIHDDWYVTLDAWLDLNESNLGFNDYDRFRGSIGLEYRFPHSFSERSREFRRF
ncbi:MAG: hypothetical protein KDA65_16020 [Planctomycetaceae bacterium]|nr:hypothetical protein [Planctomycetaceae bacterium]